MIGKIVSPPQVVIDHILGKDKDRDSYYKREKGEYHVTELLYCLRKTYFSLLSPIEETIETMLPMYNGNLLDADYSKLFMRTQEEVYYSVPNSDIIIKGKLDAVTDNFHVIDFKKIDNLYYVNRDGVNETHHKQVSFYAYRSGLDKDGLGEVLYTSHKEIACVEFPLVDKDALFKELEDKAKLLHESVLTACPPPVITDKSMSWMCKSRDRQCPYYNRCFME